MPQGMEQLYNDPDWQEYDMLTDGHGSAEEFMAWKSSGKPDLFGNDGRGSPIPMRQNKGDLLPQLSSELPATGPEDYTISNIMMELQNRYGMDRDRSGGFMRPRDYGDESTQFGDEGLQYPGQPSGYKPMGNPYIQGGLSPHNPYWNKGEQLPPLSPELMRQQMGPVGNVADQNVGWAYTPGHEDYGDEENYMDQPAQSVHPKGRQHDSMEDYVGEVPGGTDPMAREMTREVLDSGALDDVLGTDGSYIALQEFMATPEGQTAVDLMRKGDTQTIRDLFAQFENMKYDMPVLPQ